MLTKGTPGQFDVVADSGRINSRRFCTHCGTRVWAELADVGMASVNGLILDERDHFQPKANHMSGSAPQWCQIDESLEWLPPTPKKE